MARADNFKVNKQNTTHHTQTFATITITITMQYNILIVVSYFSFLLYFVTLFTAYDTARRYENTINGDGIDVQQVNEMVFREEMMDSAKVSSVQFSSVQFSSVQFSSVLTWTCNVLYVLFVIDTIYCTVLHYIIVLRCKTNEWYVCEIANRCKQSYLLYILLCVAFLTHPLWLSKNGNIYNIYQHNLPIYYHFPHIQYIIPHMLVLYIECIVILFVFL